MANSSFFEFSVATLHARISNPNDFFEFESPTMALFLRYLLTWRARGTLRGLVLRDRMARL